MTWVEWKGIYNCTTWVLVLSLSFPPLVCVLCQLCNIQRGFWQKDSEVNRTSQELRSIKTVIRASTITPDELILQRLLHITVCGLDSETYQYMHLPQERSQHVWPRTLCGSPLSFLYSVFRVKLRLVLLIEQIIWRQFSDPFNNPADKTFPTYHSMVSLPVFHTFVLSLDVSTVNDWVSGRTAFLWPSSHRASNRNWLTALSTALSISLLSGSSFGHFNRPSFQHIEPADYTSSFLVAYTIFSLNW